MTSTWKRIVFSGPPIVVSAALVLTACGSGSMNSTQALVQSSAGSTSTAGAVAGHSAPTTTAAGAPAAPAGHAKPAPALGRSKQVSAPVKTARRAAPTAPTG